MPHTMHLAAMAAIATSVVALDNGVALTPPMGFNSYMAGVSGGDGLMSIAEFFVSSGMIHSGYSFVNSDEGWEEPKRDANGKIVPKISFAFGNMTAYAKKIHDMGLKLGLYGAASGVTCGNEPGQLYNEVIDAATYASWDLDYLKSDNCASYALDSSVRFGAMRDALNKTGKRIVLSIEPFSINPDPEQSVKVSNLWRIACDIGRSYSDVLNRANIADKWAPLAGPGGWNDPDMINIRSTDTLGQSRTYFGLWAIMKSPLLLSSNLPKLSSDLIAIVNNTDIIAVNQDPLGVQARKLWVDGQPLPWLTGLAPCDSRPDVMYTRALGPNAHADPRLWTVQESSTHPRTFLITNTATDRCLSAGSNVSSPGLAVVLLPCNGSTSQLWRFDKGESTVTSVTNVAVGLALAVGNETLYSAQYGKDAFDVSAAAYGEAGLVLVPPYDQDACTSRDCQNYDNTQMWFYSASDSLFRQSTYTASINHKNGGNGYTLTQKVPTYQHHCLSHVLSNQNFGTLSGTAEVWGGPLASTSTSPLTQESEGSPDFVMALLNTGSSPVTIHATWSMLGYPGVGDDTVFTVRDLWAGSTRGKETGGMSAQVGANDIAIFRLTPTAA
eukprot:m.183415 g.183415  ORF g.183415 m.183415 type:complete len:611 (-) comp15806_c0_seq1:115-1947(-)